MIAPVFGKRTQLNWLDVGAALDAEVDDRPAHAWAVDKLVEAINRDPAWQEWWGHSGLRELQLLPYFYKADASHPEEVVRRARVASVHVSFPGSRLDTVDRTVLVRCAIEELRTMLARAQHVLGLPDAPSLPGLPSPPEDLADEFRDEMYESFGGREEFWKWAREFPSKD